MHLPQETPGRYAAETQQWSPIETSSLTVLSPSTSENVRILSSPHKSSRIPSQTRNSLLVDAVLLAETSNQPLQATVPIFNPNIVPTLRSSRSLSGDLITTTASHASDNASQAVLQQLSLVETVDSVNPFNLRGGNHTMLPSSSSSLGKDQFVFDPLHCQMLPSGSSLEENQFDPLHCQMLPSGSSLEENQFDFNPLHCQMLPSGSSLGENLYDFDPLHGQSSLPMQHSFIIHPTYH
jgi:hypothetical protein